MPDSVDPATGDVGSLTPVTVPEIDADPSEPATGHDDTPEPHEDAQADENLDADEADDGTPREARYRKRARAAEAENLQLRDALESLQRAEIQRLAVVKLADPSDLWRDGAQLADVLDDRGGIDHRKLADVIDGVLAEHPHWRQSQPRYRGPLFSGSTAKPSAAPADPWKSAFAPREE